MNLSSVQESIFPLMGMGYSTSDFASVDLSRDHLDDLDINGMKDLSDYLEACRKNTSCPLLIGGYLERRSLYQSDLFQSGKQPDRNIHLGVDIWCVAGTPIYAPLPGVIHSFANNDNDLDYGYTLIVQHATDNLEFYALYGHLSSQYFNLWKKDMHVMKGEKIATVGDMHENGGWVSHLHFQIILDLEQKNGDYPGVCSQDQLAFYRTNCPDPDGFIKKAP